MFNELQNGLDSKVKEIATKNVIKKLNKQNINIDNIDYTKFLELVELELAILKSDGKKVGSGIAVGIGISILTGGLL